MKETNARCIKCGGPLEEGFVLGRYQKWGLARIFPSIWDRVTWVEGRLETSWLGRAKVGNRLCRAVQCQRCKDCGYLEFYAKHVL